jgi:hypothetical protein
MSGIERTEIIHRIRRLTGPVLAGLAVAALSAALAAPAEAQASRTRPGGSSSGSSASRGGSSSSSSGSSTSRGSSSGGGAAATRPSSSGSGPTVITNDNRSFRHGHGHGHHGGHGYGGFYGFYGYPYRSWAPYWYWGPSWSWWFGVGYPYGYHGYGYGYGGPEIYPGRVRESLGALDTDVWPAKAEVYVDGQYVGVVDNFDGFPRYLWLEQGTYDVVFYKEGFETLARQYTVYPGLVIDVDDRLVPGESVRPEDLASKSTARRDARIARDREQRAEAARGEAGWRDRVRAERGERGEMERSPDAYEPAAPAPSGRPPAERPPAALDARGEPARLLLEVSPGDAAVYLDGRFLGTGDELNAEPDGVLVDPGSHKLSVVRPGHIAESRDFDVDAGEQLRIAVRLSSAG